MKFYVFLLLSVISFFSVSAQQETFKDVDGLLKKLSTATSDTARIILKCKLGEAYRANNPDTSLLLANEALSASTGTKFKKGEIHALILLCVLYREKGDLPYALELGLKALNISEDEKYAYEEIYSLIRIANVYFAVRDAPKAMLYIRKADQLLKKSYDDFQWSVTQYFLADGYDQLNKLDSAEELVQMLEKKHGSEPLWVVINNRLLGSIAVKRKNFPLAIEYYRKSNTTAIAGTAFREAATASIAMARVFKTINQPDSAIFYAKQGLQFGEMLSYRNRIQAASSLLAELYAEKDPKEAIKYYQIASAANDSLYGVQKIQKLQSATMKEQERQAELEAARLAFQNKIRQWALLAGIGTVVIVALILYRNNRQKQKTNKILETTLANLKATQSQLIQQEKMASLGELTAGIAHEIQNPLNFVNNFSEVNKELIQELKSQKSKVKPESDKELEEEILNDLEQNSEKINHHGKRADAIVKSMLLHSKSSSGKKEATDINGLADEYLRIAYHGMKAKDKSFTVTTKTDFDPGVGNVNIIPQDIGRVVLNLISNAFYAVDEKRRLNVNGYTPTVTVSTKKSNGRIEMIVKDNGNGIPQKVLDKIFQPFFTTKPTGQGTGLGLSLSYDIVKAHGGEITVNTKETEGTTFTIQLPVK